MAQRLRVPFPMIHPVQLATVRSITAAAATASVPLDESVRTSAHGAPGRPQCASECDHKACPSPQSFPSSPPPWAGSPSTDGARPLVAGAHVRLCFPMRSVGGAAQLALQ